MADSFDYVVVGSGPAGSLLADRLTEDRDATVCVLEAGIPDRSFYVRIPAGFVKMRTLLTCAYRLPAHAHSSAKTSKRNTVIRDIIRALRLNHL